MSATERKRRPLERWKPRSRAAVNQAKHRKRQRLGEISLRISVNEYRITKALIDAEVLTETQALDRGRVEAALAQHLDTWAKEVEERINRYR